MDLRGERGLAFIIDLLGVGLISAIISELLFDNELIAILICFNFFLIKDYYNGQSPGKVVMKLSARANDTSNLPNIFQVYSRNFFLIIYPVEVLYLLWKNKRIGDIIANTVVVVADINLPKKRERITRRHLTSFILLFIMLNGLLVTLYYFIGR